VPRPVIGGSDNDSSAGPAISRDDDGTRSPAGDFAGGKVDDTRAPAAALAGCDVAGDPGSAFAGAHGEGVTGR
jgi:hypothetical protein